MQSLIPPAGRQPDAPMVKAIKRGFDAIVQRGGIVLAAWTAWQLVLHKDVLGYERLNQLVPFAGQPELSQVAPLLLCAASAVMSMLLYSWLRKPNIYLLDFVVHRPDDSWRRSRYDMEDYAVRSGQFNQEAIDFQRKVLWYSGLGNETHLPPWLFEVPQDTAIEKARLEFDLVAVQAISELLQKTGIRPSQVGGLVVNCSLFGPTPSLCAQIMNHFKMSSKTVTYNLGGMGCAGSPIAVDLASQILERYANTYIIVVSTENVTQNVYKGTQRSMLIPNVLFRTGGAAMLMTNKRSEGWRSKYRLQHVLRTTLAADDAAFHCCWETEDAAGHRGVKLSKDLTKIAGRALKQNITSLGPMVLPWSEQAHYAGNFIARKFLGYKQLKPYVPDFQAAAQHICIHTGGRGVIDAIQQELGLTKEFVEPSRASLYRYGNVSSSSCWYVLSFIEQFRGVKRGDKVLQLGFGSGFKCNSAVWVANRTFTQQHAAWQGFGLAAMYEDLASLDVKLMEWLDSVGKPSSPLKQGNQQLSAFDEVKKAALVSTTGVDGR